MALVEVGVAPVVEGVALAVPLLPAVGVAPLLKLLYRRY